jgi:hypothetical protein
MYRYGKESPLTRRTSMVPEPVASVVKDMSDATRKVLPQVADPIWTLLYQTSTVEAALKLRQRYQKEKLYFVDGRASKRCEMDVYLKAPDVGGRMRTTWLPPAQPSVELHGLTPVMYSTLPFIVLEATQGRMPVASDSERDSKSALTMGCSGMVRMGVEVATATSSVVTVTVSVD